MRSSLLLFSILAAVAGDLTEVYVPAHDGTFVAAVLRKPEGNGPFPALLMIHGGLGGAGFQGAANIATGPVPDEFVERGYVILSTDYRRFHFGEDELQDAIAAYKKLQSFPYVDPERVGVIGASHGGYLSLMMATRGRYPAVASLAGGFDMTAYFYDRAQMARKQFTGYDDWVGKLLAGGGSEKEIALELAWRFGDRRELYDAISPKSYLDRIESPLLFIVGGEDKTRLIAKPMMEALAKRGIPALYSEHAGMPHSFFWGKQPKPPPQFFDALKVMADFVDRYVKGVPK